MIIKIIYSVFVYFSWKKEYNILLWIGVFLTLNYRKEEHIYDWGKEFIIFI